MLFAMVIAILLTFGNVAAMARGTDNSAGLVLNGTAVNPVTGKPFRHLWTSDATNGLCRLDPDVDTSGSARRQSSHMFEHGGAPFSGSQITFDSASNTIYAVDGGAKIGIHPPLLPASDSGHGLMDQVNQSILLLPWPVGL